MKKVIALLLAMSMTVAAFTGCTAGQKASEEKKTETADKTSDKKEDGDKVYHIGIIQLVEHQALDAATEGFQKALKEKLGDKVEFDVQNAQGEETNCATIATKFVNSNVDLIMANATQAVISSATATSDIPIVGTSVTDYVTTGTVKSNDAPGGNVTGTSDLAPIGSAGGTASETGSGRKERRNPLLLRRSKLCISGRAGTEILRKSRHYRKDLHCSRF